MSFFTPLVIGDTYNGHMVLDDAQPNRAGEPQYVIQCRCQQLFTASARAIRNNRNLNCGCIAQSQTQPKTVKKQPVTTTPNGWKLK